jgi:hypothetical protein
VRPYSEWQLRSSVQDSTSQPAKRCTGWQP